VSDLDKKFRLIIIIIGTIIIVIAVFLLGRVATELIVMRRQLPPDLWLSVGFTAILLITALRFVLSAIKADGNNK
jgi:hypothetical protein